VPRGQARLVIAYLANAPQELEENTDEKIQNPILAHLLRPPVNLLMLDIK
jgi:hypothetical protein